MGGIHEEEKRKERDRIGHAEFYSAVLLKNHGEYALLMEELTTHGARFRFQDSLTVQVRERETLTIKVKTPYGESVCEGIVEWVECEELTDGCGFGILFSRLSKDPSDPLRALIDSGRA